MIRAVPNVASVSRYGSRLEKVARALLLSTIVAIPSARAGADEARPLRLCADPTNLPFSSDDPAEKMLDSTNVPSYWIRPEQRIETAAGIHRFVWDLHYPYPRNVELSYPI